MTITEAAACRTPAVAYNVPGLRDSIRHMVTGILVPYGEHKSICKGNNHASRRPGTMEKTSRKRSKLGKTIRLEQFSRKVHKGY